MAGHVLNIPMGVLLEAILKEMEINHEKKSAS